MSKEKEKKKSIWCYFGWHRWVCSIEDLMTEFGYVPLDGRMASNSKCERCGEPYKNKKQDE